MLYVVGTMEETKAMEDKLPDTVFAHLVWAIGILDYEFGKGRDYRKCGGHYLIAETAEDVEEMKLWVDYDTHPCEWANISEDGSYISALYQMNNEFSITLLFPMSVAPYAVLCEVDDETL